MLINLPFGRYYIVIYISSYLLFMTILLGNY